MVQAEPHQENGSIGVHVEGPNEQSPEDAVVLNTLSYAYSGHRPIVSNIAFTPQRQPLSLAGSQWCR